MENNPNQSRINKPIMINKHNIDSDEYYNLDFYKYATYEIIKQNYPLVGEVISLFNSLENELNEHLVDYINDEIEDIGWIVICELDFSSKLKLWKRILSYILSTEENIKLKTDLTNKMLSLHKDIINMMEIRNKIAHADWDNMSEKFFVKVDTKLEKDGIRHKYLTINEEEFEKIISEFENVEERLMEFGTQVDKILSQNELL
jgi:hypothetical protein